MAKKGKKHEPAPVSSPSNHLASPAIVSAPPAAPSPPVLSPLATISAPAVPIPPSTRISAPLTAISVPPATISAPGVPLPPLATISVPPAKISAPSTSISSPLAPASSPATRIAFREFIELADLENIKLFLDTATSLPEGENLRCLWDRAFKEGLRVGHQLYVETVGKLNKAHNKGYEEGYSTGYDEGRQDEQIEWRCEGHSGSCFPLEVHLESSTQTDPPSFVTTGTSTFDEHATINAPPPIPATMITSGMQTQNDANANLQLSPPLVSASPVEPDPSPKPMSLLKPSLARLDWADDAASLLISSLPIRNKRLQPYLFQPFRNRQSFNIPHQTSFRYHSPPPRFSSTSVRSAQVYPHHTPRFSPSSALNWEGDPRLFEPSRALNALGWVRP